MVSAQRHTTNAVRSAPLLTRGRHSEERAGRARWPLGTFSSQHAKHVRTTIYQNSTMFESLQSWKVLSTQRLTIWEAERKISGGEGGKTGKKWSQTNTTDSCGWTHAYKYTRYIRPWWKKWSSNNNSLFYNIKMKTCTPSVKYLWPGPIRCVYWRFFVWQNRWGEISWLAVTQNKKLLLVLKNLRCHALYYNSCVLQVIIKAHTQSAFLILIHRRAIT